MNQDNTMLKSIEAQTQEDQAVVAFGYRSLRPIVLLDGRRVRGGKLTPIYSPTEVYGEPYRPPIAWRLEGRFDNGEVIDITGKGWTGEEFRERTHRQVMRFYSTTT